MYVCVFVCVMEVPRKEEECIGPIFGNSKEEDFSKSDYK